MNNLENTPIKISNHALAARSIRNELKKAFPGIKFQVTSKSYSMGDSVSVRWIAGPTSHEVDLVAGKYQHGDFDGMTDCYNYKTTNFHEEFGSAKYVQTSRSYGDTYKYEGSLMEKIGQDICTLQRVEHQGQFTRNVCGQGDSHSLGEHVNILFSQTSFKAGEAYKGVRFKNDNEPMFQAHGGHAVWLVVIKEGGVK